MSKQKVNRRQILGGAAAATAAGAAAILGTARATAAEPAAAPEPAFPDLGPSQAPTIKDLKDKVCYITGGSSGIGLGIARALHEKGAKVVLGNLDDKQFAEALKMFPANDPRVATVVQDVMKREEWEAKADEIEKKFGPVDILVNNAGVGLGASLTGTYNDWDWGMGVNFWGPVYGIKTFVPRMRARAGSGCHIVTTTSTSGVLVGLNVGIYAVSKIAATGLMEQLRNDLRATNIGTSTLIPGLTQTNISQSESHRPEDLRNAPAPAAAPRGAGAGGAAAGGPGAGGARAGQRPAGAAPAAAPSSPYWARPQDPLTVGRIVVDGILNNDLFIFPAPEYRQGVMARAYSMIDSMVPVVPFPPNVEAGIASNSYLFTPMYTQEVAHRRATRKRNIPGV